MKLTSSMIVLQTILLILKFAGVVSWSWWLIMLPMIITLGLISIGVLLVWIGMMWEERKYKIK